MPDWTSDKPFAGPDDPVTSTCWDCGATWLKGQDGSHSCVSRLKAAARDLFEDRQRLRPLLERCERLARDCRIGRSHTWREALDTLLADLRRELGKK